MGGLSTVRRCCYFLLSSHFLLEYHFSPNCRILQSLPSSFASYLSFLPRSEDGMIKFSWSDEVLIPLRRFATCKSWHVMPNPLYLLSPTQHKSEMHPWLARMCSRNAGEARNIIRRGYTRTWKAFLQVRQVALLHERLIYSLFI